ncbi:MAG: phosphatidylglycerophosphate synthase [Acidimicrobiales bacterium]|nr:phosphatidylglycerophosphate synthase [Acidimicrobiales bacterium]
MAVSEPSTEVPGPAGAAADGSRVLTVPNVISLVRLLCMPVFVYLLFGRDNRAAAASLLAVLGASDWIDGYIARHYDQVSDLGKILDPVADRLLFFVGIIAILIDGTVPVWLAWMVLVREFVVAATTIVLGLMGARRIDVTWWGKAGTFGLMFAFPLFLASESTLGWADTARVFAWVTAIPGLTFSYIAWALYLPMGLRALREGRADRAALAAGA